MRKIPYIVVLICIAVGISFGYSVFGGDSSVKIIESRENSSKYYEDTSAFSVREQEASEVSYAGEGSETSDPKMDNELIQDPVPDKKTGEKKSIWIYVCGAVMEPDVYELPEGSRVFEAIEAAGGLAEDAQESAVNQALILHDQDQLRIPSITDMQLTETPDVSDITEAGTGLISMQTGITRADELESESPDNKVNINTAGEDLLTQIPGIGTARAAAIIRWREENGNFRTIEDIMNVSGIKQASFEKLKDHITVSP